MDHTISCSKYNPLAGGSYIKSPQELDLPRKGLINIQNTDDNVSKKRCEEKHVDLLIIGKEGKRHYVLIKDFNTFMNVLSLSSWKKTFLSLLFTAFCTEEILERHIQDCFKINGKQRIIISKKDKYVKFKNYERKIKSLFIIYRDFESILVPGNNGKQNLEEFYYANKYKKYIACSYGYKLVCVHDKFSKPFKTYLGENAIHNFINSMIKESKYCSGVMKKHFKKELVMTKEDNEDFKNSTKRWICDNDYIDTDVKSRDHCHITGKYGGSAHRDCNINLKLNHKIPIVFRNLRNYDSNLIMQEIGKFNLKISVIPNGLEKCVTFTINNKLSFIYNFQFLSFH